MDQQSFFLKRQKLVSHINVYPIIYNPASSVVKKLAWLPVPITQDSLAIGQSYRFHHPPFYAQYMALEGSYLKFTNNIIYTL